MSSVFFDAGDLQRLDRERTLIEQSDRIPAQPDRSPDDDLSILDIRQEPEPKDEQENGFDFMSDGLLEVLQRRLQ